MRIISYFFMIVILLLGISFACLNAEAVTVNLYVKSYQLPLSLLLVIVLGIGMAAGFFVVGFKYLSLKQENWTLKHRVKLALQEVSNLRAIPLKNDH